MRVIVTGGTGLTGTAIVRALRGQGHDVTTLSRTGGVSHDAQVLVRDVNDVAGMREVLRTADVLVHAAGIRLAPSLAGALRGSTVARIVAISSAAIASRHQPSRDAYAAGENALLESCSDVVLIRPTLIYGSRRDRNVHHVIDFARRWRFLPLLGSGSSLIQPIHYLDLAEATAQLVDRPCRGVVEAGGGRALTLREAAVAILEALGLRSRLVSVPLAPARAIGRLAALAGSPRWAERIERSLEDRNVDNARLLELTSLQPRDFIQGVRDQVADFDGR